MDRGRWIAALKYIGIGWYVGGCIGGGAWVGHIIDRARGDGILFTLVGLGVGIALAMFGLFDFLLPGLERRKD